MTSHKAPATILLLGALLSLAAGCTKAQPPAKTPVAIALPHAGDPGIGAAGAVAIAPAAGGTITEAQVRAYVSAHRVPRALTASNVTIREIDFVTSKEVSARLHSAKLRVADDEPMCLVILNGRFVFPGPPGQTPAFPIGIEVFNARTGRLLQFGGMPAKAIERR